MHVKMPLSTAMILIILQVLQKRWSCANRRIQEIGVYPRSVIPIVHNSFLTIPIVILYIPFHVRCLPDPRLDPAPQTSLRRAHKQLVASLRGVSAAA